MIRESCRRGDSIGTETPIHPPGRHRRTARREALDYCRPVAAIRRAASESVVEPAPGRNGSASTSREMVTAKHTDPWNRLPPSPPGGAPDGPAFTNLRRVQASSSASPPRPSFVRQASAVALSGSPRQESMGAPRRQRWTPRRERGWTPRRRAACRPTRSAELPRHPRMPTARTSQWKGERTALGRSPMKIERPASTPPVPVKAVMISQPENLTVGGILADGSFLRIALDVSSAGPDRREPHRFEARHPSGEFASRSATDDRHRVPLARPCPADALYPPGPTAHTARFTVNHFGVRNAAVLPSFRAVSHRQRTPNPRRARENGASHSRRSSSAAPEHASAGFGRHTGGRRAPWPPDRESPPWLGHDAAREGVV